MTQMTDEDYLNIAKDLIPDQVVHLLREHLSQRAHVVAYQDRDPAWIFVPDTFNRGRYCRVPYWFAFTTCEHCGALEGQPCVSDKGGKSYTGVDRSHTLRRAQANRRENLILREFAKRGPPEDVIDDDHELWRDVVEGNSP